MSEEPTPYVTGSSADPRPKDSDILTVARFLTGNLTEGQLGRKLNLDRLDTRRRVADFLNEALDNASVPIERIATLEQRLATLTAQVAQLSLENHDLRNRAQVQQLRADDLEQVLVQAQQRLEALVAAAREVCRAADDLTLLDRRLAIKDLAKLIDYPGWYAL